MHAVAVDPDVPASTRVSASKALLAFALRADDGDDRVELEDQAGEPSTWADQVKIAYWRARANGWDGAGRIPGGG